MSLGKSLRWQRGRLDEEEDIPAEHRWHGSLKSTIGKSSLSRVRSTPSLKFGTSARMGSKPTGEKHAYDIPLSTLKHTSSAKWAPRSEVLHHDAQRKQREAEQAVGPYAQYPGERPSTIGKAANVKLSRIPSSPAISMTKRPPLSLVTPEQIKYNAHHLANSYSSFGPQALSSLQAAPTAAIEKAKQELKVPLVSPVAQFPAGQVSSFGRQSLSTRSSSKRALLRTRGKVNPIPRQWSDVGPAAYMPPSTFGNGGAKTALPANLAHTTGSRRRVRTASGSRGAPIEVDPGITSLKQWLAEHDRPGTASAAQPRKQRGAARRPGTSGGVGGGAGAGGGEGAPQTLSEWLESYGKPTKGTMFQHMETRRPRLTRGLSMGRLKTRGSAAPSPIKTDAYAAKSKRKQQRDTPPE